MTTPQEQLIDKTVGANVRTIRTARKMSQETLGRACGITFQQVQKYEKGTNRVGASRLVQFARILNVDVAAFFDGLRAVSPENGEHSLQSVINENKALKAKLAEIKHQASL